MIPAETLQRHQAEDADRAWAEVLSTEAGRRVMWNMMEGCRVFHSSMGEPGAMAFAEGVRAVGLDLLTNRILPHDPALLGQMMADNAERVAEIQAAYERENSDE